MDKQPSHDLEALERARQLGHEARDVRASGLVIAGAALLGLVVFGLVAAYGVADLFGERPTVPGEPPKVVVVEENPAEADLKELRLTMEAGQQRVLDSYGWVDQGEGIARIPIDRAIELLPEVSHLFGTQAEEGSKQ